MSSSTTNFAQIISVGYLHMHGKLLVEFGALHDSGIREETNSPWQHTIRSFFLNFLVLSRRIKWKTYGTSVLTNIIEILHKIYSNSLSPPRLTRTGLSPTHARHDRYKLHMCHENTTQLCVNISLFSDTATPVASRRRLTSRSWNTIILLIADLVTHLLLILYSTWPRKLWCDVSVGVFRLEFTNCMVTGSSDSCYFSGIIFFEL